ncbi:MAG: hypothetical protein IJW83_01590 [Clostridia bacterium]|nr:hypothetical protein [Clostridia bacterium]
MQESKSSFKDMVFYALRKWRVLVVFAVICAVVAGSVTAVIRILAINDEDEVARWQAEYEIAYGAYWAAINDFDRLISENDKLASQAQIGIEKLAITKSDYEGRLVDLDAKIVYNEARIEDYTANIEELRLELEKLNYYLTYRREQNENSLLMAIDPYDVNTYDIYLRVDSGYEILPDNTYQNIDPTPELLTTYRLLVSNTAFYNTMIDDLDLDTEARYLTEVIAVGNYNINSMRIRVISDSADWAKAVAEYISDAILSAHTHVSESIAEHELIKYNTAEYSTVDLATYSKQYEYIQEAIDYESDIRDVGVSILNLEAGIRDMNTEIREFRQEIDDIHLAINELPLEAQALENKIDGYRDANFTLRAEQLTLLAEPEPEYGGYTALSVCTGFVKFALIGGVVGAFLAAVWFALVGILRDKVLSSEQLCSTVGSKFFGFWPKEGERRFARVDRWIDRMAGHTAKGMTPEHNRDLVLSNVTVACADRTTVLVCGGATGDVIATIADAVKAQRSDVQVLSGGTVAFDPAVVRGMAACDAVVLVEQLDASDMGAAVQLKERAQAMNKPVLGVIVTR